MGKGTDLTKGRAEQMKKVLVLDIGKTSGKALLCSYENKSFAATTVHCFAGTTVNNGGKSYRNIEGLLKEIDRALDKAQIYGFDAVSVNALGDDFVLADKNGNLLLKPLVKQEPLTEKEREEIGKKITEQELYMRSGVIQKKFGTLYRLLSVQAREPALIAKASSFMMIADLINYHLTGKQVCEYTSAASTGLVDLKVGDWSYDTINLLGFPKKLFGKIAKPGERIGTLKGSYADKEIPVFAAPSYGDAAAIMAVPSTEKKFAYIDCGERSVMGTELTAPVITDKTFGDRLSNCGGCGGAVVFSQKTTGTYFLQECRRYFNSNGEVFTFNDMEAFAKSAPPFVAKINLRDPSFNKSGNMPQKVQNYCETTGQTKPKSIAQTLRIIYESIAADFSVALEEMERITADTYPSVYVFGGGSKDSFLCQLIANATGRTVVAGPTDAVAIGNAMSSLMALGEIKNAVQARSIVRRGEDIREFVPEMYDGDGRR
ncbi:MAG: FGGY family carbohydrate kinase [Firmicutes bacterium]|nr:FGGY family carbohydrate kinase [[Eubacterium] siraeum]MCM1487201.1 FGGY family carbohydrate kinase [Bacillota bacterium]